MKNQFNWDESGAGGHRMEYFINMFFPKDDYVAYYKRGNCMLTFKGGFRLTTRKKQTLVWDTNRRVFMKRTVDGQLFDWKGL